MKKVFALLSCFVSFSCVACPVDNLSSPNLALAPNCEIAHIGSPSFCSDFRTDAHCYCGLILPQGFCNAMNMDQLYARMIDSTPQHTQEAGCRFQEPRTHVPYSICMEHWTYYRSHCR